MSRKKVFLLFISLILISFLSNAAYAAEEDKGSLSEVADTIQNMFGFLPNIITLEKLLGEDAAAMFWARFLVWLLLFAVTYFGAGFVFKDNKRVATVVALVISLMGALLMPDNIIVKLFQTYGFLSGLIIWVAPVLGGFFVVSKIKPKLVKALIYLIILFVLMSIDKSITSNFGKDLVDDTWYSFFRLLLAVVIIAFLWNLLTAWGGGGDEGGQRGTSWNWPTRHDDRRRDDDFRSDFRPMPPGTTPPGQVPAPPGTTPPTPPGQTPRTNEKELVLEKEIWELLKKLQNNEHLRHLIGDCRNKGTIGKVEIVLSEIISRTHVLERLEKKEMQEEDDNLREQRLKQLRFENHKFTDPIGKNLLNLIRQEINLFKHYMNELEEINKFIHEGIDLANKPASEAPNEQVKDKWNKASNATLLAMRLVELLIRINAIEITKIGPFKETGK